MHKRFQEVAEDAFFAEETYILFLILLTLILNMDLTIKFIIIDYYPFKSTVLVISVIGRYILKT